MLHRLPEQHDCLFDHLGRGREEAVLKMVKLDRKVGRSCQRIGEECSWLAEAAKPVKRRLQRKGGGGVTNGMMGGGGGEEERGRGQHRRNIPHLTWPLWIWTQHLPAEILVFHVVSIFLDSLERGHSGGEGGRGLVGWICSATLSIACSHTRSLNPRPSLQQTDHRDQSSYISHFYSHAAMVAASLLFFFTTGSSRVVVALGWTDPSDWFPFLSNRVSGWVGGGSSSAPGPLLRSTPVTPPFFPFFFSSIEAGASCGVTPFDPHLEPAAACLCMSEKNVRRMRVCVFVVVMVISSVFTAIPTFAQKDGRQNGKSIWKMGKNQERSGGIWKQTLFCSGTQPGLLSWWIRLNTCLQDFYTEWVPRRFRTK